MAKKPKTETEQPETENDVTTESPETPAPDAADESAGVAGDDMPTAGGAKISAIGDTLVQEMPDVQQHAIDQEAEQTAAKIEAHSGPDAPKDKNGETFDPAKHKANKYGEPTLTKLGKLILKPGRKPGGAKTGASVVGGTANQKVDPEAQQRLQARATGVASANMVMALGMTIGGEEWQPRKQDEIGMDEKSMLENAFADYFEATGKTDIPPGMALTVAIGAYALPRFTMPKTQSRVSKLKKWFVKKAADRKLKKHGLKATDAEEKKPAELEA